MTKKPDYDRGYTDGVRMAITWLHTRAKAMNDPQATMILNSAATNLGWDFDARGKQAAQRMSAVATCMERLPAK